MERLNTVLPNGTFGMAVSSINTNFSLIVSAINGLEYSSTKSKGIRDYGFIPSTETLPNAANGDWCMVLSEGNTFPATIWTFDGTTWSQGGTWNPEGIDLSSYAKTTEMTAAIAASLAQAIAQIGYAEVTVSGTTLSASLQNYVLPTSGGTIHLKMSAPGTGASTLNINNTGAKELWYNGAAVSDGNTWEANEIISVFYDGTRYMASNSQGGGKADSQLDENSTLPVQNKVVTQAINNLSTNLQDVEKLLDNEIFDLSAAVLAEYNTNYITHAKTETGGRWTASANNSSGNTLYITIPRLRVGKRYKISFDYTSTAPINKIMLGRLPLAVGTNNRQSPTPYINLKSVGGAPEAGQIDADILCDNAYVQYISITITAAQKNTYFEINNISIVPYSDMKDILAESQYGDFEIADPMGNILALFRNGHIMTRNFNSENLNGSILSKFKGKKIAIVGDSISTYQGWLPSNVPGFVGTAYATYYPHGNVDRVEKTWWYQMAENLGLDPATAIANTSWSGGVVCGDSTSTTDGKPSCSTKRISDIAIRGFVPDIIIIFISCNDWYQCGLSGYNTTLGDWTIKDPIPAEGTVFKFRNAYALMLAKIRQTYPLSRVFCCTILDDYRRDGISDDDTDNAWPPNDAAGITTTEWNNNIKEIAEAFACDVIDIHNCGITYFNIQDNYAVDAGLHPNAAGMALIAQKVTSELISKY